MPDVSTVKVLLPATQSIRVDVNASTSVQVIKVSPVPAAGGGATADMKAMAPVNRREGSEE